MRGGLLDTALYYGVAGSIPESVFLYGSYIKTHFVSVDGRLTAMSFPKHKVCFYMVVI